MISPPDEPAKRSHRSRCHHIEALGALLGPTSHNTHPIAQSQLGHDLGQKGHSPKQRFQQNHRQIRTRNRQGDPRKPGTAADIDHRRFGRDQ